MPDESATVLVVDTAETVADCLADHLGGSASLRFLAEPDLDEARTRVASTDIDAVVFYLDPLDDAEREAFLTDVRTIAPECPVVLFTGDGHDTVSGDLLTRQTTLVERTPDPDTWAFLVEKIRSSIRQPTGDRHDEEMYRMLVESARDGLYRLDAGGNLVYANESWAQILGYERGEILGAHASTVMADGELERGQQLVQQLLEADDAESDIVDLDMITSDGDHITVAIHFVVLTTDEGLYDGVMGVARDVTDRRADKRELERTNERLDEFASVVSHDLRNPLNVAEMRLDLLRRASDGTHTEHIDAIDRALTRMDTLVEDLLTLAREGESLREIEQVDLGALSERCWQTVETGGAELRTDTDREIFADRSRLKQLLSNLMRNAVEHGTTSPDPQPRQDATRQGSAHVTVTVGELPDGFFVEDDGPGIPQSAREDVFDAGYSTSEDGTGFGLNIAKQVVDAHDWTIEITDGEAGGARFEITDVTAVG